MVAGWLLDGQIGRLGALEDLVDIRYRLAKAVMSPAILVRDRHIGACE